MVAPPPSPITAPQRRQGLRQAAAGAAVWLLAGLVMWQLDVQLGGRLELANLALVAVLAAAVVALWWPLAWQLAGCAAAVLAFNYSFVPPRGSFAVSLHQHALLLLTLLTVSWIVALLMERLRRLARQEHEQTLRMQQLHSLAGLLRDADDPRAAAGALQQTLAGLSGGPVVLMLLPEGLPRLDDPAAALWHGQATAEQRAGLWLCARDSRALGPGTGRHEEQPAWYLPLRGRSSCLGAAFVPLGPSTALLNQAPGQREHAQALCDQMGQALQRAAALRAAARAHEEAQAQRLHNTLLAAISHDYRTPLATILGAASALHDQADRLSAAQRHRLAASIVDEAGQLRRLTDNTLQLARLDAPGLQLSTDWQSVEELVGSVLRRLRQRDTAAQHVKARLEPGLPLVRCDAVLMVQLLENLVDNALKHGTPAGGDAAASVEIVARTLPGPVLLLAVRDRGPGVPPQARERVFESYARGAAVVGEAQRPSVESQGHPRLAAETIETRRPGAENDESRRPSAGNHESRRPGAGVGLALCRAIARAHGGELTLRTRSHGGSSFECRLPLAEAPTAQEAPQLT